MQIQHQLGADIMFAFDELHDADEHATTTRSSRSRAPRRGRERCVVEHQSAVAPSAPTSPRQALFGVVQGAQHEDLRRQAARGPRRRSGFDGYGVGGAIEKENLGTIVALGLRGAARVDKPRHLLGISEPDDLFTGGRERLRHLRLRVAVAGRAVVAGLRHDGPLQPRWSRRHDATSGRSTRSATATRARTTPRRTCTTCSRPRSTSPRRCARSTTSASPCGSSTTCATHIEAGTFADFKDRLPGPLLRLSGRPASARRQ